ncbi:AbrB family transcriptional regulator [Pseudorhodobacter sp. W20_MBD10_FR17]|uniref:AbrB family transcriptional regulator n=1 Tax=Pseudorhodobacter sp. W20_MBD10_FR17 TaxID=3240266 RepID=UPI003F94D9F4
MTPIHIGKTRIDPPALAATLALGTTGGVIGKQLGLPLGYLLGSLVVVAVWAIFGKRVLGQAIHMPQPLRMSFIPIVGVGIGGAFTPEIFYDAAGWWPSVLGLLVFVPLAHFTGYKIYRAGGLTPITAYFGAVPGGLIESVTMGEEAGADVALLVLIQFLRLILTIVFVPVVFLVLTGHSVGSSAGVVMIGGNNPLEIMDILVLSVAAIGGYFIGKALRFPAAIMTGPLAASALAHLTGLTDAVPPSWTISLTQVVVGTGLGARFAGMATTTLRRGFGLAVMSTGVSLALAFGFAEALHLMMGAPISAIFLAFAPGGITEMSLIALSLHVSVVFVTLHHVIRIVVSVSIARYFVGRVPKDGA